MTAWNESTHSAETEIDTDVLIIGGGPAGTWAALSAARLGAKVVLVDKGYCGASGATASAGTSVWYVDPDPTKRLAAMESREALGGYLQDRRWMGRVLDRAYDGMNQLADWGYPFPLDDNGGYRRSSLQGPEYMRLMRKRVKGAGVKVLDHSPALELLRAEDGSVAGAVGVRRQKGERWRVNAKAVVIAAGGCAFLSKALGCNVLTGDGYLMAAEAGAELSGMEFSNAYAISPVNGTITKTLFYNWATFTYADGSEIPGAAAHHRSIIAKTLETQKVFAQLDKADGATRISMRDAQPNFFLPLDRAGIDPFTQRFEVTLRLEGTVRGTGGLRIVDDTCATTVPGLYAAGDAATRELICGAFTGGGSHNAAWAMSSGYWSGEGAATFAKQSGAAGKPRRIAGAGQVALRNGFERAFDPETLIRAVQAEIMPYNHNYFRRSDVLIGSLLRLDALWQDVRRADAASLEDVVKAREGAAMLATARWMYNSALTRRETRGMHKRTDYPDLDINQRHHVISGGLDDVWITHREAAALPERKEAA